MSCLSMAALALSAAFPSHGDTRAGASVRACGVEIGGAVARSGEAAVRASLVIERDALPIWLSLDLEAEHLRAAAQRFDPPSRPGQQHAQIIAKVPIQDRRWRLTPTVTIGGRAKLGAGWSIRGGWSIAPAHPERRTARIMLERKL